MESIASVTAALKSAHRDNSADEPIDHYIEVAGQQRRASFLKLAQSMPCSIISGDRLCGRGATIGGVVPNPDGTWLLMPICTHCKQALAATDETFAR